jgi:hypothetical protein
VRNVVVLILTFWTVHSVIGQVATIQDPDGWTNVRETPGSESRVVYKVYENEVFWFDYEVGYFENEWVEVYIPKNKFSFATSDPDYLKGFIHKSRIIPVDKLPSAYGSDFSFKYQLTPFDSTNKVIDRVEDKWIVGINGRPIWGVDGGFPKIQVAGIDVTLNDVNISIHPLFYSDIYECDGGLTTHKYKDTFFVYQMNSDGAGAYQVVWVFDKNGLKQRLVGSMI